MHGTNDNERPVEAERWSRRVEEDVGEEESDGVVSLRPSSRFHVQSADLLCAA